MNKSFYLHYGKNMFDRFFAVLGVLLLSPIFLFLSILIKIETPGPVFFRHQRVGQNFKPIGLLKFRSMVHGASTIGPAVTKSGDARITGVGKYLRKYKIDELPQLVNVLLGDISLVGPRPEVEKYVKLFRGEYEIILKVKPGITDYAALTYRNEEEILAGYTDLEQGYIEEVLPVKIELYKQYLSSICFYEDIRIIFYTLYKIPKG